VNGGKARVSKGRESKGRESKGRAGKDQESKDQVNKDQIKEDQVSAGPRDNGLLITFPVVPPCEAIRNARLIGLLVRIPPRDDASPPVEQHAGNNEHCRNREHVCKRFRRSPLGGFFHPAFSLELGHDSSLRETHATTSEILLGTPLYDIRASNPTPRISMAGRSNSITAAIGLSYVAVASNGGYSFGKINKGL